MKTRNFISIIVLAGLSLIYLSCMGGSTEIGNARSTITGSLSDNNNAASGADVKLVEAGYIPGTSEDGKVFTSKTDCFGEYVFEDIPFGTYFLSAGRAGKTLLRGPYTIEAKDQSIEKAELAAPVSLSLTIDTASHYDVVFIKGRDVAYDVTSGSVKIENAPAGEITIIAFKKSDEPKLTLTSENSTSITLTVSPKTSVATSMDNAAPRFLSPAAGLSFTGIAGGDTYSVDLDAADAENEKVLFSLDAAPEGMRIDSITGVVTWSPALTAKPGSYSVWVRARDASGNAAVLGWDVTLADRSVTIEPGSKITVQTGMYILFTIDTAHISTNAYRFCWDGADTTSWQSSLSVVRFWAAVANSQLSYQTQSAKDGSFSAWSAPMTVVIGSGNVDTIPPVLKIGDIRVYIPQNGSFYDQYSAWDAGDGRDIDVVVTGQVDSSKAGEYTLTYTATDSKGNTATITRVVVVEPLNTIHTRPPIITLLGSDTLSLKAGQTIDEFKATWVEPGYHAVDDGGNDITSLVTVSPIMYLDDAIYVIRYNVKDSAGNNAAEKIRRIKTGVGVPTAPVIILTFGDSVLQVYVGSTSWTDPGYFCTDFYDGTIPNSNVIVNDSLLVNNLDHEGGPYKVTYTVTNSLGVVGYAERMVMVVERPDDVIKPTISLMGRNPDTVIVGSGNYVEPGYRALDNRDGDVTGKVVVSGTVNTSFPGKYEKTYMVTDLVGNRANMVRTVYVIGIAPGNEPVIYLARNEQPLEVVPFSGIWNDPGYIAYDAVDGLIYPEQMIILDTALVNHGTEPGTYTVHYFVTNSHGYSATASRTVTVLEFIDNPYPPVITLKGRNPDTVVVGSTAYTEPGFTAIDNRDGDVTAKVVVTKNIDLTRLGTNNTVTYTVSDATGNTATASRAVHVVADTTTTDLFARYLVPSPEPLPTISGAKWFAETVDGDGPDVDTSNLKSMDFSWNKDTKAFTLNFTYVAEPFSKSFSSIAHTFAEAEPSMTLVGSEIPLMDAKYYVSVIDEQLIWVESNKKFAIIWKKGE